MGGEGRDGKHRSSLGFKDEHTFNPTVMVLLRLASRSFLNKSCRNVSMWVVISQVSVLNPSWEEMGSISETTEVSTSPPLSSEIPRLGWP